MAIEYVPVVIAAAGGAVMAPKVIVKLIETIQQGVGTATEPYFIRKRGEAAADAEAYRIKKLASTLREANEQSGTSLEYKEGQLVLKADSPTPVDLDSRYLLRTEYQGAKKQLNVENVTSAAVEELLNDPEVETLNPEGSPDPDWVSKFFSAVEDVSDEEMQRLWAKVLAGEVKQPQSFSFRTLEFLKTLSKSEAELFTKVAKFSAVSTEKNFIGDFKNDKHLVGQFGVKLLEIVQLSEIGFIFPERLSIIFRGPNSLFEYQGKLVALEHDSELRIPALIFTQVGTELLKLLPRNNFNPDYLKLLVQPVESKTKSIWWADLVARGKDDFTYQTDTVSYLKKSEVHP